jgi:ferredoxin
MFVATSWLDLVPRNILKLARIATAVLVFTGLTIAFVDFRGFAPARLGHVLAHAQFVPGFVSLLAGAMGTAFFVVGVIIALAIGRVYCSAICPLGILQDIIAHIGGWFPQRKNFLPFAKPQTAVRQVFLWGTVVAIAAGWGGFALALVDPYSNFGRIASMLARPLLTVANNSIVGPANAVGIQSLYRVEAPWAVGGALLLPAVFLTVIAVMSALRGRLYCNTLCPVGTVLGMLSKAAAFRIAIDKTACTKCGDCLRSCKAQCIDLRAGTIDASRCVACYNCVGVCDHHGIGYRFSWKKKPAAANTTPAATASNLTAENSQRRAFLASIAGGVAASSVVLNRARAALPTEETPPALVRSGEACRAVSPPGSKNVEQFLDRCTSCHLCISACPTHVLQPAFLEYGVEGLLKPRLDYRSAFCLFECTRCGKVCPDDAIGLLDLATKQVTQIGVADFHQSRCIVEVNGTDCAACSEHCPTKAVTTKPFRDNLRIPSLDQSLCIGCGACEYACPVKPTKAILVTGRSLHARAEKLIEKKATAPAQNGDFPF